MNQYYKNIIARHKKIQEANEKVLMNEAVMAAKKEIESMNKSLKKSDNELLIHENFQYQSPYMKAQRYGKFLADTKKAFLVEAWKSFYDEFFDESTLYPMTPMQYHPIAKQLLGSMIDECGGTDRVLSKMHSLNYYLAEVATIVEEAAKKVKEKTKDNKELLVDKDTKDDFYKKLMSVKVNSQEFTDIVKGRILDAIQGFNDENMKNKTTIQNIIYDTSSKLDKIKNKNAEKMISYRNDHGLENKKFDSINKGADDGGTSTDGTSFETSDSSASNDTTPADLPNDTDDTSGAADADDTSQDNQAAQEAAINAYGRRQITRVLYERPYSVFTEMTRNTAEGIMNNKGQQWANYYFTPQGKLDFNKITSNVSMAYGVLELMNTYGLKTITVSDINNLLTGLKTLPDAPTEAKQMPKHK